MGRSSYHLSKHFPGLQRCSALNSRQNAGTILRMALLDSWIILYTRSHILKMKRSRKIPTEGKVKSEKRTTVAEHCVCTSLEYTLSRDKYTFETCESILHFFCKGMVCQAFPFFFILTLRVSAFASSGVITINMYI